MFFYGFIVVEKGGQKGKTYHPEQKTMSIVRTVTTITGHGVVEQDCTKTKGSARTITISNSMLEILKQYKEWQEVYKQSLGELWKGSKRVFTSLQGERINPSCVSGYHKSVLINAGLPHYSLHSLRHTNITLQILAGVPLVTESGRAHV